MFNKIKIYFLLNYFNPQKLLKSSFLIINLILLLFLNLNYVRDKIISIKSDIYLIKLKSLEEIKKEKYKELGYDYFEKIASLIPEKGMYPTTRYKDYTKNVHLLSNQIYSQESSKLIIGFNLSESDLSESFIAYAKEEKLEKRDFSLWSFKTINDIDQITKIKIILNKNIQYKDKYCNGKIWKNREMSTHIYEFDFDIPSLKQEISIYLPNNNNNKFSFGRGSVDFIIQINCISSLSINSIEIYGLKVNLSNFRIIHNYNMNFLAIDKEFYKSILRDNNNEWKGFLYNLKNVN